jgi:putative membrane protein
MHLGKRYTFPSYLVWTRWEIGTLFLWSLFVTSLFELLHWTFLEIPAPLLEVVGIALAIILGFKNQECFNRVREAQATWEQIESGSILWAAKLASVLGNAESAEATGIREFFYRHFAWLTVLRFGLRETKTWENIHEKGNKKFLADLPTPESRSVLNDELATYLSAAELQKLAAYRGDKANLIIGSQYRALGELFHKKVFPVNLFIDLMKVLDDLVRLQASAQRIKNYPYARNYYSIAVILVKAFVGIVPLALFPFAQDAGKSAGIEHWTAWLNVPFSVFVGWIFVTLEKVGENSSNPFEGGPNDVPISFSARRIEIEMRTILGEQTDLKPIEPKYNILF